MAAPSEMVDYPLDNTCYAVGEVIRCHEPSGLGKENQLQLALGEVLYVLEEHESGWLGGHKEGDDVTGWFPAFCVRLAKDGADYSCHCGPGLDPLQLPTPNRRRVSTQAVEAELRKATHRLEAELAAERQQVAVERRRAEEAEAALAEEREKQKHCKDHFRELEKSEAERRSISDRLQELQKEYQRVQEELRSRDERIRTLEALARCKDEGRAAASPQHHARQMPVSPVLSDSNGVGSRELIVNGHLTSTANAPSVTAAVAAAVAAAQAANVATTCLEGRTPQTVLSLQNGAVNASSALSATSPSIASMPTATVPALPIAQPLLPTVRRAVTSPASGAAMTCHSAGAQTKPYAMSAGAVASSQRPPSPRPWQYGAVPACAAATSMGGRDSPVQACRTERRAGSAGVAAPVRALVSAFERRGGAATPTGRGGAATPTAPQPPMLPVHRGVDGSPRRQAPTAFPHGGSVSRQGSSERFHSSHSNSRPRFETFADNDAVIPQVPPFIGDELAAHSSGQAPGLLSSRGPLSVKERIRQLDNVGYSTGIGTQPGSRLR